MRPPGLPSAQETDKEIAALIETLHSTGQRLEHLTAGEVDGVADREGRTFLLRHAQDQLRDSEAAKQAAILDALPAHVALLDARGSIISTNAGWRKFASANGLMGPHYAIGINYLDVCDRARGADAAEAQQAAAGIRSILAGAAHDFSLEYPCHSPTQQRWFLMTVTPLADDPRHGVVVMHLDISEQTRAEEVRRQFVAALDTIADGIFLTDRTTMTYLYVNDAACRQQNLTRDELLALGPMRLLRKSRADVERDYDAVINSGGTAEPFELLWTRADGSPLWVELRRHAQWSGDRWTMVTLVRDITEKRRIEARILRLNRVYAVQSGINALIVRVHDREELFTEACRIAVEAGAFRTAWIGVIDPQTLDGRIVAWHGADHGYVNSIKLTASGATAESEPPACRALRQGQTVISNDIATEPSLAPRREVLLQRGYRSMGCFPLVLRGRPEAVIALFAGEPDFFDAEEVKLLADLAANLSFALDNLEHEKTLRITEAQRQQGVESLKRFSSAMDATADAIYLIDRSSMRFIHVNDAACRMQGKTREELLALGPMALLGTSRTELERTYDEIIASGVDAEPLELLRPRKDGSQAWIELRRHAQRSGDRWTIITLGRDITERKRATQELRESEARFRGLTALSTDWYWQQDETLRFVNFSGGDHVQGWGADQMTWVGKQRWEIPGIMPLDGDWTEHKALLQARQPFRNFEYQRRDADGGLRYVAASGEPIFGTDGAFAGYRGVATDITARKAAENRIRRLNRVYAVLSGINTLIVRVRDRDELFREACRIAVEAGGFRMSMLCMVDRSESKIVPVASAGKDEVLFAAIKDLLSSPDTAPKSMVGRAIAQKVAIMSNDVRSDSQLLLGKYYRDAAVRSLAVLPLLVADIAIGTLVLYSEELDFFDEEEMKLLTELAGDIGFAIDHIDKRERLDYLAYYDVLTGLANRNLFVDRVTQHLHGAVSGGHQLAVVLIDLERFKNINDSLGQAAGDSLLKQVAAWLTRSAGDVNLLARIGADHFAAVMPEVRQEGDLTRLIEKTITAFLDHPFRLNDAVFRVAVKVGVALFPDDGADAETLFRNAEAALKQAKATGERYLFYKQQMNASVAVRVTLENQLRQALDNDEFVLHYQPKVSLASGKLVGAEALIRWNDPRIGLVPPGRFIPILEETGLIYEVGRWALRQAIADYLRWHAAGLPAVRIAVNVSPLQLRHRGFIDEIGHAVAIDPLAAAGLELEITESLIMEDVMHSIASLQAIRDMGISVAIDDFGTGFSSLSYLAKLPVDTLKIDRSFVVDMTAGPQGLALVSTIIKLAHSLKLKVVAEGVETEEQQHLLHLLDCDEMQGFLFSKPLPAEVFEARFLCLPVNG